MIFCFITATWEDCVGVAALAADGTFLATHISSNESFAMADIGFTAQEDGGVMQGTAKHKVYREAYPDGFTLVWVEDPSEHAGVVEAARLNGEQARAEHPDATGVFKMKDGEAVELTPAERDELDASAST